MEDILASIKRVIKEGDVQPTARRGAARPPAAHEDDALPDLSEPVAAPPSPVQPSAPSSAEARLAAAQSVSDHAMRAAEAATAAPETELPAAAMSSATVEATRGALGALSRLVVRAEPEGDGTLEGLVRDMLRPMVSEWLDQNLPRLVEQMVAREIAKITSGQG